MRKKFPADRLGLALETAGVGNSFPVCRSAPAGHPVRPPRIHDPCFDGTLFRFIPAVRDRLSAGHD
jgi:hypothetical protein